METSEKYQTSKIKDLTSDWQSQADYLDNSQLNDPELFRAATDWGATTEMMIRICEDELRVARSLKQELWTLLKDLESDVQSILIFARLASVRLKGQLAEESTGPGVPLEKIRVKSLKSLAKLNLYLETIHQFDHPQQQEDCDASL